MTRDQHMKNLKMNDLELKMERIIRDEDGGIFWAPLGRILLRVGRYFRAEVERREQEKEGK